MISTENEMSSKPEVLSLIHGNNVRLITTIKSNQTEKGGESDLHSRHVAATAVLRAVAGVLTETAINTGTG